MARYSPIERALSGICRATRRAVASRESLARLCRASRRPAGKSAPYGSMQPRDDGLEHRARLQLDLGLADHAVVELEGLAVGLERRRAQPALDHHHRAGQRHAVAEPVAEEPRAGLGGADHLGDRADLALEVDPAVAG